MATTSAAEIRSKNRKEVTLKSGNTYLIRKATQRDYVPRGLVSVDVEKDDAARENAIKKYMTENYNEVIDIEVRILVNCVLQPRLVASEPLDDATLSVRDLGEDRDELLEQIAEFSGLKVESKKSEDGVPAPELPSPGVDGGVLRETPA